jgi:phenylalanyl-tRNA synthetase beta chain
MMKVPISWVKDFVDINLSLPKLARLLTMAGLEVEGIHYVGMALPEEKVETHASSRGMLEVNVTGLEWAADKIVTAAVLEVMPHPNADRLVLCRLDDGQQEHIVLTGAPNLYPYKGAGPLAKPLKVAYAREGARIYDGHQPGQVLTTLKRAKIRGVDSYSMICSEKELGISEEHEGVIILDEDAPVGVPLVEYMGDAVFEINIIPNIARVANIQGVAREIAALTGQPLRQFSEDVQAEGPSIEGKAAIVIENAELNPRFVLGLIENIEIKPSPYYVQRRLRLAGMRPINNIVDATNYAMLELGEPLHAFDYDILVQRAGGKSPTIITRTAKPGERLTTLDDVEHQLDEFAELVTDTAGALSIAGVMGGAESEVGVDTQNVLLEGAAWNFINVRRTMAAQRMSSEAGYRFSRGVHPAMAPRGVKRGLELMRQWAGGLVYQGLVDNYPLPPEDPMVEVGPKDVRRWLGINLSVEQMADLLRRLEFAVEVDGQMVRAKTPDHRLDIGVGINGVADLMEEIARIYGYDNIPETRMADELPPQRNNPALDKEERLRDLLVALGLQEIITYRLTSPEREARRLPPGASPVDKPYVHLANPIAADRNVLRHSLLSSVLEVVERNNRIQPRMALFEIGPVFLSSEGGDLPDELPRLVIVMTGPRELPHWQGSEAAPMDFYDLKGVVASLLEGLHLGEAHYEPAEYPSFHPGKTARIMLGNGVDRRPVGVMGELHPLARKNYDLPEAPVLAAELDMQAILDSIPEIYSVQPVSAYPPVLEDLAIIVDEDIPAERVAQVIVEAGGKTLAGLTLFDVYRGGQIGTGKKSLAYSLTYQAPDRTLTDQEVLQVRQKIIRRLEQELSAKLRS